MPLSDLPGDHPEPPLLTAGATPDRAVRQADRQGMTFGIHLLLALLTFSVFGQTVGHQFVRYDDQTYVYENPAVTAGITARGVIGAFTHTQARNWHPLTTISHMLDCQLFGLHPAGHHLTNVLLHTATVLLLFSILNAMTGALWRSAFVAAVFAIHPLRAESVAWIAERKDVLSGLFFMLTVGAYWNYVRRPSVKRYLAVAGFFALGLMSKPMLVTLPLLLLALDYWPLERFQSHDRFLVWTWRRLILEKVPFLVLSALSAAATLFAQRQTVDYESGLSLASRIGNGLVSCVAYIWQMFWPLKLAVFYPYAGDRAAIWQVTLAFLFMAAIALAAWRLRKRSPYFFTGLTWYLVGLVPVIGIVPVGLQGRADRYTYLSQIGLYLVLTWGAADLSIWLKRRREVLAGLAVAIIGFLAWLGWIQTSYWRDTETLWTHAAAVIPESDLAHYNVAGFLMDQGRLDDAIAHYEKALQIRGSSPEGPYHLSVALIQNSLGNALARKGLFEQAISHYRQAIELRDDFADAHTNLAAMLVRTGQTEQAIGHYEKALAIPPEEPASHLRLALVLLQTGRPVEALDHYQRALQIAPRSVAVLDAFAWVLATSREASVRNAAKAVRLAETANRLAGANNPFVLRTLATSYAASGRFSEAGATAQHALHATADPTMAHLLEREIRFYAAKAAQPGLPTQILAR